VGLLAEAFAAFFLAAFLELFLAGFLRAVD
jgi:hypothetical protein